MARLLPIPAWFLLSSEKGKKRHWKDITVPPLCLASDALVGLIPRVPIEPFPVAHHQRLSGIPGQPDKCWHFDIQSIARSFNLNSWVKKNMLMKRPGLILTEFLNYIYAETFSSVVNTCRSEAADADMSCSPPLRHHPREQRGGHSVKWLLMWFCSDSLCELMGSCVTTLKVDPFHSEAPNADSSSWWPWTGSSLAGVAEQE